MKEKKIPRKTVKGFVMGKKKLLSVESTLLWPPQVSLSFGLFYNSGRENSCSDTNDSVYKNANYVETLLIIAMWYWPLLFWSSVSFHVYVCIFRPYLKQWGSFHWFPHHWWVKQNLWQVFLSHLYSHHNLIFDV